MKVRNILIGLIALIMTMVISLPLTANAYIGGAGTKSWNVLVLILPDVSITHRGGSKQVTTMHYAEIEKIKNMAEDMKGWSTHHVSVNVDVKVDYEDITRYAFSPATGDTLPAGCIESQIDRNSKDGEYDSILVVYRAVDNQGGTIATTQCYSDRKQESNGATYATLPLKDPDHSLSQFTNEYPEGRLMLQLLDSVVAEVRNFNPDINYAPYISSNPAYSKYLMMDYMHSSTDKNDMANNWDKFLK